MTRKPDRRDLDPRAPYAAKVNAALAAPDPTLGWTGDASCFAVWNRLENRYEVWRTEAEGDRCLVRCPSGERLDVARLLKGLVERDTTLRNRKSVLDSVNAHNDALDRAAEQALTERTQDTLERVYHALAQERGHLDGYVAPIALSGRKRLP